MGKQKLKNVKPENAVIDEYGETVASWDGRRVIDLADAMLRAHIEYDCMLTLQEMPHRGQIPADIAYILNNYECDMDIWACDLSGNCMVSSKSTCEDRISTVEEIRAYLVTEYGLRLDIDHLDNVDLDADSEGNE